MEGNPINPYYTTPKTRWSNTLNQSKQIEKTGLPAPIYSRYIFVYSEITLKCTYLNLYFGRYLYNNSSNFGYKYTFK